MPNPGYYPNARLGLGNSLRPNFFSRLILHHTFHPGFFPLPSSLAFPSCWSRDHIPQMPLHPPPHCDRSVDHHQNYNHLYFPPHVPIMEGDAGRRYSGAQRHRRENQNEASNSPSISPRSPHSPYPLPYHHGRGKFHPKFPPPFLDGGDSGGELSASAIDQPPLPSPSSRQRHSMPDVVYTHGPRLPSSPSTALHGARARFVSLPTISNAHLVPYAPLLSLPLPRVETTECDRLERACGRVPAALLRVRDDPPPSSPHQPRGDGAPPPPAPKWPHWTLVLRIKRALRRDGKDVRDYVEAAQIDELFLRDVEERARRELEHTRMTRVRAGKEPANFDENAHVIGVPLNESVLRAPATAILGGYRHDLPLVVFLCVEELYRTGIYKSGLFRDLPNRQRHHELRTLFDTPPAFGEGMNLRAESTADICALLLTYLKELPEPVLTPYLFNAFWNWCVRPSVKRDDERTRKEQDEDEELRARYFQTGQRPPRPSRRVLFEKARLRAAQDDVAETGQVAVARDLLRLLPTHSFSLIVYLCSFFTQVPLCPENGIALEDIGRIFGPAVFGGPVPAARRMMVWFLKRWNRVSDGLLDPEPDDPSSRSSTSSSSSAAAHKSGRDARLLERADSFELLAPEEDYDEELDFRGALVDPLDERRRPASYNLLLPQHEGATKVMLPPSDGPAGWLSATFPTILGDPNCRGREHSLEPDAAISQIPSLNDGQSNPQTDDYIEEDGEALLPPHVFASTSARRQSMSSASQYGTGDAFEGPPARVGSSGRSREVETENSGEDDDVDVRQWGFADAQLLIALSRLHEAHARIDKLEHAVVDAATQSERACEKLAYIAAGSADLPHRQKGRFEQGAKLVAVERDEANELVKNVCTMLKGVVQPALA